MEPARLKAVLHDLGYNDDEMQLEAAGGGHAGGGHVGGGHVGGVLVSARFAGHSQERRQNELWEGLRARLKPEELVEIVAIMTMTPDEIAA